MKRLTAFMWAGSAGYSDAQPDTTQNGIASRTNFNGVTQAYVQLEDAFDLKEKIRFGRSNFILANGLVLGSCDFLQMPATFTGVWLSRQFAGHDVEVFMMDNYGPLQSQLPGGGERFWGVTGRLNFSEGGLVQSVNGYYMSGTEDGEFKGRSEDSWFGCEAEGFFPGAFHWRAQFGHRQVAGADDVNAYRIQVERHFEGALGGFLRSVSLLRTDSEGAMHVNPADFSTAGLLHQYGGAWRSDLDTNQLAFHVDPGAGIDLSVTLLTLDRDGSAAQLGTFETDILAGKEIRPGIHVGAGYGIDNDERQVGYFQATVFF